jgi:hypothetical protein
LFDFRHGIVAVGVPKMYSESEGQEGQEDGMQRMQGKMTLLRDKTIRAYNRLYGELIGRGN